MKLRKNFVKTTSFKNSYFNRIVDSWNCLPREVRFSHDLHSFRRGVSGYLGWAGLVTFFKVRYSFLRASRLGF